MTVNPELLRVRMASRDVCERRVAERDADINIDWEFDDRPSDEEVTSRAAERDRLRSGCRVPGAPGWKL